MTITGWAFTDARNAVACPKCKAAAGDYCRQPKGRKAPYPHPERMSDYIMVIGREEFLRRHQRRGRSNGASAQQERDEAARGAATEA